MQVRDNYTAHQTYEALFWILVQARVFGMHYIANALQDQLMKCYIGFESQWRVYDVSTSNMNYTHSLNL